jgi:hypothetical protein
LFLSHGVSTTSPKLRSIDVDYSKLQLKEVTRIGRRESNTCDQNPCAITVLEETLLRVRLPAASTIRLGRDAAEADGAPSEPQRAEGESKGFILQAPAKQLDFDSR